MSQSRPANSGGNPETSSASNTDSPADRPDGRETDLPVRLNLDFMFGRGYLWAESTDLTEWLTLESLRMEIPDLSFPLDARGGIARFQHKRCHLREIELNIHRRPFAAQLRRGAERLEGFRDLQIRFIDQSIHVQVRLEAFGSDAFMSFRMALIPPEPPRGDEVHISLYDHRAFGPLPYPARLMGFELLTGLLNTDALTPCGAGHHFQAGVAGDIVRLRPFRMAAAHIFPPGGWKIPNLRGLRFQSLDVRDDSIRLKGAVQEDQSADEPAHALRQSQEGGDALAAYQAKDAFADADASLFDSDIDTAIDQLHSFRDRYELHPELVSRLLDALLCDPTANRLAEARSLCRELESADPDSLPARLARPVIALAAGRPDDAADAYERLADLLKARGDFEDWVLAELATARLIRDTDPTRAVDRLREVLETAPRHRYVLEELRDLARRLGQRDLLEESLKRLATVYTNRDTLYDTYLELAELLLQSRGEVEEARAYVDKLLQIEPDDPTGLELLGTSYTLGDQPVRAVQALSSAAREAEARNDKHQASRLHGRVARLWYDELDNPEQALMSLRSGLLARPSGGLAGSEAMAYGDQLTLAAEICEELGKQQEAIGYWSELVALLGRLIDRRDAHNDTFVDDSGEPLRATTDASGVFDLSRLDDMTLPTLDELPDTAELEHRLVRAQRHLASLYDDRGRPEAAASHWRRVVELHPGALDAIGWLDDHFQKQGRPENSVELMEDLLDNHGDDDQLNDRWQGELHRRLARLHDAMQHPDASEKHRSMAQRLTGGADLNVSNDQPLPRPLDAFEPERAPLAGEPPPGPPRHSDHSPDSNLAGSDSAPTPENQARQPDELPAPDDGDLPTSLPNESPDTDSERQREELAADDMLWGDDDSPSTERIEYEQVRGFREQYRDLMGNRPTNPPEPSNSSDAPSESADDMADHSGESPLPDVPPARNTDSGLGDPHSFAHPRPTDRSSSDHDSVPAEQTTTKTDDDLSEGTDTNFSAAPDATRDTDHTSQPDAHADTSANLGEDSFPDPPAPSGGPADSYPDIDLFSGDDPDPLDSDDTNPPRSERHGFSDAPETPTSQTSPLPEQAVPDSDIGVEPAENTSETLSSDSGVEVPSPDQLDDPDATDASAKKSSDQSHPEQTDPTELRRRLDAARRSDDHSTAVDILRQLVDLFITGSADIEKNQHLRDRRDLGELLFFDLDRPADARPHFEAVRRGDPDGLGADRMVLSALETIYKEAGNTDGRADILRARLEHASSEDKRETYCMLLAQLHWESERDAERAEHWLDEILNQDPTHEGAHRLYAEIARSRGDYNSAADHLESVLDVAGEGLDAVEIERELAQLQLDHLDRPDDARNHFENVLDESPGDARALEGLQACHRATGDSRGLLNALARELGLLIGRPEGITALEMSDINPSEVDEGVRIPAAQILGDAADLVENEMGDVNGARQLWETARRIWSDYVEALERRIELDRRLGDHEALADGLESLANQLLDPERQLDVLREAADIYNNRLDAPEESRRVLARAIEIARDQNLDESTINSLTNRKQQLGHSPQSENGES